MKKIYILELKNPTYFMSISLTAEKEKEYEIAGYYTSRAALVRELALSTTQKLRNLFMITATSIFANLMGARSSQKSRQFLTILGTTRQCCKKIDAKTN